MNNVPNKKKELKPILSKTGLVFSERNNYAEILCKPKLLPLKSINLEEFEKMQQETINAFKISTSNNDASSFF